MSAENKNYKNAEVVQNYDGKKGGVMAWLPLILAIIYAFSPIDLVPDFIPVAGWFEDALFVVVGGLNAVEKSVLGVNTTLGKLVKMTKWVILILGIIAGLIIVLLGVLIFKAVTN